MPDLIEVVVKVAEVCDRLALRFAIGGALANNYWGVLRATEDVDCLISLPAIKYQLFADDLMSSGFTLVDEQHNNVPISVSLLKDQVSKRKLIECSYPLEDEQVRVEFFIPAVPLQDEILRRAVPIRIRNREIRITTAEDLILLKLVFHRDKDLRDVRGILWVQRGKLDLNYLRHWSARTHEEDVQKELEQLIDKYSRDKGNES